MRFIPPQLMKEKSKIKRQRNPWISVSSAVILFGMILVILAFYIALTK